MTDQKASDENIEIDESESLEEEGGENEPAPELESESTSEDTDQDDDQEVDESEEDQDSAPDDEGQDQDDDIDLIISIDNQDQKDGEKGKNDGETPKDTPAPKWVKELRKEARRLESENHKLKNELQELKAPKDEALKLDPRPKFEDYYDDQEYEVALEKWVSKKNEIEAKKREARQRQEESERQAREIFQKKLDQYQESKKALKVKGFDDAEDEVTSILDERQQGIILQYTDKPEQLVYALGNSPKILEDLSNEKDLIKFTRLLTKVEGRLTVEKRSKPKVKPEKRLENVTTSYSSQSKTLERLEKEAAKTGDLTAVINLKRKMKKSKG